MILMLTINCSVAANDNVIIIITINIITINMITILNTITKTVFIIWSEVHTHLCKELCKDQ